MTRRRQFRRSRHRIVAWVKTRRLRRRLVRECKRLDHPLTMRLTSIAAHEPGKQIGERLRCPCGRRFKDVPLEEL